MSVTLQRRGLTLVRSLGLALAVLAWSVLGPTSPASAALASTVDPDADLILFWGDGCPH
ncbi:MAG: hypothetical protein HGA51_05695, partial [Demequinaceae bacterium]|nr:hypothetical protein [Demequinaceae bacterium]